MGYVKNVFPLSQALGECLLQCFKGQSHFGQPIKNIKPMNAQQAQQLLQ
jgi:hypothetical protein